MTTMRKQYCKTEMRRVKLDVKSTV